MFVSGLVDLIGYHMNTIGLEGSAAVEEARDHFFQIV